MACTLTVLSIDACSSIEPRFQYMNALTIKQPFASLVVFGLKTLEIRSRQTHIRGRVLICSSQKPFAGGMFNPDNVGEYLDDAVEYIRRMGNLAVHGHAIGMVDIVGCHPMQPNDFKHSFVKYTPGMFAWELENAVEIEPFPVVGQLGFFKVPANLVRIKSTLKW